MSNELKIISPESSQTGHNIRDYRNFIHPKKELKTGIKLDKSYGPDEYKLYCNWLMNDISGWLNDNNKRIVDTKLQPIQIVNLIKFIKEGKITGKIAKTFVVAPNRDRSGSSHYLEAVRSGRIKVERVNLSDDIEAYSVDGYPADCVVLDQSCTSS